MRLKFSLSPDRLVQVSVKTTIIDNACGVIVNTAAMLFVIRTCLADGYQSSDLPLYVIVFLVGLRTGGQLLTTAAAYEWLTRED